MNYYRTPDNTHHMAHAPGYEVFYLVTLHDEAPAIERLRHEPGLLAAWGVIPSDEATYTAARQQALDALSAEPKPSLHPA